MLTLQELHNELHQILNNYHAANQDITKLAEPTYPPEYVDEYEIIEVPRISAKDKVLYFSSIKHKMAPFLQYLLQVMDSIEPYLLFDRFNWGQLNATLMQLLTTIQTLLDLPAQKKHHFCFNEQPYEVIGLNHDPALSQMFVKGVLIKLFPDLSEKMPLWGIQLTVNNLVQTQQLSYDRNQLAVQANDIQQLLLVIQAKDAEIDAQKKLVKNVSLVQRPLGLNAAGIWSFFNNNMPAGGENKMEYDSSTFVPDMFL